MTPQSIITTARHTLNDEDDTAYRNSNDELLRYVNAGIKEASMLAPQLFYATGDMECAPLSAEQGVSCADAQALAEVIGVRGGGAILPCDMSAMTLFMPNWRQAPPGPAVHWMRHTGDPLRFYLYPPAPAEQVIEIKYVRNPQTYALDEEITELPPALEPALVDYVIHRAENKDDEFVNSNRATAEYQRFLSMLKPA